MSCLNHINITNHDCIYCLINVRDSNFLYIKELQSQVKNLKEENESIKTGWKTFGFEKQIKELKENLSLCLSRKNSAEAEVNVVKSLQSALDDAVLNSNQNVLFSDKKIKELEEENKRLWGQIQNLQTQLNQPCPAYLDNKKKLEECESLRQKTYLLYLDKKNNLEELQKKYDDLVKSNTAITDAYKYNADVIYLESKLNESNRISNAKTEQIKALEYKIDSQKQLVKMLQDKLFNYDKLSHAINQIVAK